MSDLNESKTVFFVGSGVSRLSGLPLFSDLKNHILPILPQGAAHRLEYLSMEALLSTLATEQIDVGRELRKIFNHYEAEPNLLHKILAQHAVEGDIVWTTNYDTLIEESIEEIGQDPNKLRNRIRKPHGTFLGRRGDWNCDKGLLFRADQSALHWPKCYVEQMKLDARGSRLILVGYSGRDTITYDMLTNAIDAASSVQWFEAHSGSVEDILTRFNALEIHMEGDNRPKTIIYDEDYNRMCQEFGGNTTDLPNNNWHNDQIDAMPESLRLKLSMPSIQFKILERAGERDLMEDYHDDLWRACLHNLKSTYKFKIRNVYFSKLRRAIWAIALELPIHSSILEGVRSRAVNDINFPNKNKNKHIERLETWARQPNKEENGATFFIALSRCFRELGRYACAIGASERALEISRNHRLATKAAHAQFEIVEAARSIGDIDKAEENVRFHLENTAMIHWIAWMDYEVGCIALQKEEDKLAEKKISKALTFFGSTETKRSYQVINGNFYCSVARAAVLTCTSRPEEALQCLDKIDKDLYSGSLLKKSLYLFRRAEALRLLGRLSCAKKTYSLMDTSTEMHGALMHTGLGLTALSMGDDSYKLHRRKADDSFNRHGCIWGIRFLDNHMSPSGSRNSQEKLPPIRFV